MGVSVARKLPCIIFFDIQFFTSTIIGQPQAGWDQCYCQTPFGWYEVPCPGTGQDGEQRSGVPWSHHRFPLTYRDSTGPCADQSAGCDANVSTDIITDNFIGLMWAKNGYSQGPEYVIPSIKKHRPRVL